MLEICGLALDNYDLVHVLGSLTKLQELKLVDMSRLTDRIFQTAPEAPYQFPALRSLTLLDTSQVTSAGLTAYLSSQTNRDILEHLSLSNTGVLPQNLHEVLAVASNLRSLSIVENVENAFPNDHAFPPMASKTLIRLHYEITSDFSSLRDPRLQIQSVTGSYHSYLIACLLAKPQALPALTELYVRDRDFPEALLLAATPPPRPFAGRSPVAATYGFNKPLSIYTKGIHDFEWNFASTMSETPHSPPTRPISVLGSDAVSTGWARDGRLSMVVGNGVGGFLAVREGGETARPASRGSVASNTSGGDKRSSRADLWR